MRTLGAPERDLDFSVVDGLESVMQRVIQRLRFWIGTWFLQTDAGVPYLQSVFGFQADERMAARIISDVIREVEDVTGVRDVVFRIDADRVAHYSATVDTVYGEVEMSEVLAA